MRYWLGLGSNLGDRGAALQSALERLAERGVRVQAVSPVYSTAPQEVLDQPEFFNAAVVVDTDLQPLELLDAAKEIEDELGRRAGPRYGPRPVDCDLLLWDGGRVDHERLTVPHPRLAGRRFALVPLLDLDPALAMPDGRSLADLADALDPAEQRVDRSSIALAVPGLE